MSSRATLRRTFTQAGFNRFAKLSGDLNPIHVDPEFSANSRFGRTVAHGLLLLSIVRELADQLAPGMRMVEQDAMFPAPSYANEEMRFACEGTCREDQSCTLRFEVTRVSDGTSTCKGTCLMERS